MLELADSRGALLCGFLFVIAAGLAREYDAEYLLAEPWHLLLPLGASLLSSSVLTCLLFLCFYVRQPERPSFFTLARRTLTLFWLTAPMALLYAIPYERVFSAKTAALCNLLTLGVVATWRVLVAVRFSAVLANVSSKSALCVVMLMADVMVLFALDSLDLPLFAIMGGVRLNAAEQTLVSIGQRVFLLGFFSLPVWALWSLGVLTSSWRNPRALPVVAAPRASARSVWAAALVSLLVLSGLAVACQPEQRRRWQLEQALRKADYEAALDQLCVLEPSDLPPHYQLPPRRYRARYQAYYEEVAPDPARLAEASLARPDLPSWVRKRVLGRVIAVMSTAFGGRLAFRQSRLREYVQLLLRWPRDDLRDRRELSPLLSSAANRLGRPMHERVDWPPAKAEEYQRLIDRLAEEVRQLRKDLWPDEPE